MFAAYRRVCLGAFGALFGLLLLGSVPVGAVDNPTVKSVTPNHGSDSGGESVTLLGSGFYCGTGGPVVPGSDNPYNGANEPPPHDYLNVYFGNNAAVITSTPSDGKMTVTSPSGEGTVDVTVTCVTGTTVSSAPNAGDRYTYENSIGGGGADTAPAGAGSDAASSSSLPSSLAQTGGGPAARVQATLNPAWAALGLLLLPALWFTRRRFGRR